jgi:hypothetical protein
MFFELKNGKVVVTDQGLLNFNVKELYDSDHTKGKEKFQRMAEYAFFMYDKRSIYRNLPESERQGIICLDVIQVKNYWIKAEANNQFQALIAAMNKLQYTHNERLLEGCKRKIDEYIDYFQTMKISDKNYKDYGNVIKGSEDLVDFYDKLEAKVNKEVLSKQVGGGESKMFEEAG